MKFKELLDWATKNNCLDAEFRINGPSPYMGRSLICPDVTTLEVKTDEDGVTSLIITPRANHFKYTYKVTGVTVTVPKVLHANTYLTESPYTAKELFLKDNPLCIEDIRCEDLYSHKLYYLK